MITHTLSVITPHSVGLLLTSDQSNAENFTWQHATLKKTDIHAPAGFEPTIPASERPHTHTLDRAATGTGNDYVTITIRQTIKITSNYRGTSPCLRMYRISFSQVNAHRSNRSTTISCSALARLLRKNGIQGCTHCPISVVYMF